MFRHGVSVFRKVVRKMQVAAIACALVPVGVVMASPARISSRLVDLGEVHKIYLAQGLAAIVQLPYPVTEAKVGNPDDIQVQVSKTLPSELTLILKRASAQTTNLIARCGSRTFVFDLIPSKKTHQDLVRISGSYGAPETAEMGALLLDSSRIATGARTLPNGAIQHTDDEDLVLIDSSFKGQLHGGTQSRGGKDAEP